ncbi:hypothetical protein MIMGU_mgv1a0036602mg, partial [Erythranthe guttata]
MIGNRSI